MTTRTVTSTVAPGTPVLVTTPSTPPPGYRLTATQVLRIASRDGQVQADLRRHPRLQPYEYTKGSGEWQVSWFTRGTPQKERLQVYVDDARARVTQAWTGFQVAWTMARGYAGAFGRRVNAVYIWIPLCLLFVAPFWPWPWPARRGRRRRRGWGGRRADGLGGVSGPSGGRRPTLLHLDLLVLLGFSISLALFNHAQIGLSVPLVYPFLIYLLVRMLLLAFGSGIPREPLRTVVPVPWLGVAAVFLMAFRIALNVLNSNVIDVGYSGVIGADKLIGGVALYGHWPSDNMYGDTYGPVSYYLYVPFRLIFGWSGRWDSLPAAHAAAIFFDLLTVALLFVLGRRLKGNSLGILLAYGWAAYPFTLFTLDSNTNDSLVAALVVLSLLAITSAPGRGIAGALAGLTKLAPFALAPLLLRGVGSHPPRPRSVVAYAVAFAVTVLVSMLSVVLHHDLTAFWQHSVAYQSGRVTPFSVYGMWGGLGGLQHALQGAVVVLAVVVAFVPRRRGPIEVAALGAAVLIALQLTVNYWLYPYIVWFFPLVMVAILASHPEPGEQLAAAWAQLEPRPAATRRPTRAAARSPSPAGAGPPPGSGPR